MQLQNEKVTVQRHKTNILLRLERNRSAAGEAKGRAGKRGVRRMKTSGISSESGERNKIKILLRSVRDCAIISMYEGFAYGQAGLSVL